ncbi:MAG TPA: hypothetical protein VE291_12275 [Terracidiphilus sp.]|jgi:hypothetical protein|nr:hypothetical protein [Terracidiphilus sp.]
MRRALSILLVLFFGFGPLSATVGASDDAGLPACCRSDGAHRCAMSLAMRAGMTGADSRTPGFTAPSRCPFYPNSASATITQAHALTTAAAAQPVLAGQIVAAVPYRASIRVAPVSRRSLRGPPISALA